MDRVLLKEFKNGNKLWGIKTPCVKCSGSGQVIWSYADHVCFDCDGKGWYYAKETEYTPENLRKHEALIAKKAAEKAAEAAQREAEHEAMLKARQAEQTAFYARRKGHFYGEIGQKIELEVTFKWFSSFDTAYGTTYIYRFDTDDGAHLVWKSSAELGGNDWIINGDDRITIRATIKAHNDYHGIDQTELQRVKVLKAVHKME